MITTLTKKGKNIMSKKHFIDFAKEIANLPDRDDARVAADVVIAVALRHNVNFNTERFLAACDL